MKLRSARRALTTSAAAFLITVTAVAFGGAGNFAPNARAATADKPSLKESAAYSLDEAAGSQRVSGGASEDFLVRLAGGAQLGAAGKTGTALRLNGTSAYAATSGPVVDTTKSFSVSAWVKLDKKDKNYTFLSQAGTRASGFQLYYSKYYDKFVFNRHLTDTDDTEIARSMSKQVAQTGMWTHLTGSYDAAEHTVSLFVNGALQEAAKFTTPWRATGGLQVGRLWYKGTWQENMPGLIDDIRTVQSIVTPADAAAITSGKLPSALQELASFPLNEPADSDTASGGNGAGLTATLAGGAQLGAAGKTGTALRLNGTSAYAATSGPVVDTMKSFSVSAWVKLDKKDKNYTFLSQAGTRASGFQLYYSKDFDKFVFNRHAKDADDTIIVRSMSSDVAQVGVWTQLTGIYDAVAKKIQLFVNGTPQVAAAFTTPWRAGSALQIGRVHYKGAWQENLAGSIDDIRIGEPDPSECPYPQAIGHRGAPQIAPENTLASLEAAADLGADLIETDIQYSKDGTPILMHDETVDRMTDGTGRVDQLTDEEISVLTVNGGGRVPTLVQALQSLKARSAQLLLEIKGPRSASAVDEALKLVSDAGMTGRTILQSFDEQVVRDAHRSAYRTEISLLRNALDADPVEMATKFSLDAYSINFKGLSANPSVVEKLQENGVKVFVWTVDKEYDWQVASSQRVDGVITNVPDRFLSWRNSQCAEISAR
jgi:glycerophosphoryl diester phosphodiesterase